MLQRYGKNLIKHKKRGNNFFCPPIMSMKKVLKSIVHKGLSKL